MIDFLTGFMCGFIIVILVLIICVLKKDCKPEPRIYPIASVSYEIPETVVPVAIVVK